MDKIAEIADKIHSRTCGYSHIDQCSYFYQTEEDFTKPGTRRNEFYKLAQECIDIWIGMPENKQRESILKTAISLLKTQGTLKALHYYKTNMGCSLSEAKATLGL